MRITIDGKQYNLEVSKLVAFNRMLYYQANSPEGLTFPDGTKVKIGSRSLMRTALKMIMTPIVIPFVQSLYSGRGLVLRPPEPHSDLIDYSVHAILDFLVLTEGKLNVILTSRAGENSDSTIESISPTWEEERLAITSPSTESTENG